MKLIAHRGNLTGPNPIRENSIDYIEEAISEGFDVEIDLRVKDNQYYLGHDNPQYFVTLEWLEKNKKYLWIHCKNREALEKMSNTDFNYFWHESDSYTLTSKGVGWVYPGQIPYANSVIVMPESISLYNFSHGVEYIKSSYGICTDTPIYYKEKV